MTKDFVIYWSPVQLELEVWRSDFETVSHFKCHALQESKGFSTTEVMEKLWCFKWERVEFLLASVIVHRKISVSIPLMAFFIVKCCLGSKM